MTFIAVFFRELQVPVIPFEIYHQFINASKISDYNSKLIEIKNLTIMQCDALLLEDANAIVNESMLTGESIPITKTGIGSTDTNDIKLNIKEHKKHILFSGTQVIQTRIFSTEKARAIVLRTGTD